MNHVPVGSGIRGLHVRTGAPAMCARVANWLADYSVQAISCDDAFEAVAHLIRNPETVPDIVLVGLDWLDDDDFGLFAYLHDTWPAAAVVTYVQESLRRDGAPHFTSIDCRSPDELAGVLANPPSVILGAALAARNNDSQRQRETPAAAPRVPPALSEPPEMPPGPELPPLRDSVTSQPADNARVPRRSPIRTVTRPADLLTAEELAALLKKDFR